MGDTDTNAKALAEEELPVLRALGGEEHASDKEDGGSEYRKPKMSHVEYSSDEQPWSVGHCALNCGQPNYSLEEEEGGGPERNLSMI